MSKTGKILFIITLFISSAKAQDTLKINIQEADNIFLKNSFYLLASSMNIEAQKAQIIQAKLFPNPTFTADLNTYDPGNKQLFNIGNNGQKAFQLEQLIILGGKRKSEIDMAKTNAAIAELEFQQLSQSLSYQLHSNLFTVGQQQSLLIKYAQQLTLLDSLLSTYQVQVNKGNIPLKELVRLKGAYLKLNNDRAELYQQYFASQATLQKILQVSSIVKFEFTEKEIADYIKTIPLDELRSIAATNRPDMLIMMQNDNLSKQYLQYQKRLAIPDISVFTSYDQAGSVFPNEINAGITIPLPLWNRNQGNIKAAEFNVKQTDYQIKATQNEISTEIQNAYAIYMQTVTEYNKANSIYNEEFEITIKGMTDNFQKRNVSIIEFIDFFESYNEVLTELTRIKTQLVSNAETLNLLIGKKIY